MYLLDTNALSALRSPKRSPAVADWLREISEERFFLSVVTLGEIERGITSAEVREPRFARDLRGWIDSTVLLFADRLLPFGAEESRVWGRLSVKLGYDGSDLQIAATALVHNAVVVTGNTRHFESTGVAVENPFLP